MNVESTLSAKFDDLVGRPPSLSLSPRETCASVCLCALAEAITDTNREERATMLLLDWKVIVCLDLFN